MRNRNFLFNDGVLRILFEDRDKRMEAEINELEKNYLLNANIEELSDYFEKKFFVDAPKLKTDDIHILDDGEVDIDVSQDPMHMIFDNSKLRPIKGTKVTYVIPFTGDPDLFKFQPSSYFLNPPIADIKDNELRISYETTSQDAEQIKGEFKNSLKLVQNFLSNAETDASTFNSNIRGEAKKYLEFRKKKILKDQGMVASLGYPLKKRDDAPTTYRVPDVQRKPSIKKPQATTKPFKSEPTLDTQEYDHILKIISNMVFVIEKSPKSFSQMGEEPLRDHFLVQLNGQYEGQATGETFNCEGKTDIIIKQDGQNLFIAECKFWTGPKGLLETVDQLLGYVTWRDTKTAIVIFNRTKNFSSVLSKIAETMKEHPNFIRDDPYTTETSFRFILHNKDDQDREFMLTVMAFDVPPSQ